MASKSPASPPPALSPAQARIDWLTIPAKRVPVLPQWLPFHRLPPMALGPKQLNIEESAVLISLLKKKDTLESTSKLLQRDAEPISLDHWLRAVFELWRETGGKTPDRWILTIMNLGGDACATALGNAARQWAKDLNRVRANEAILQLQRIGSIASLMEINHIAQTTHQKRSPSTIPFLASKTYYLVLMP